MGHNMRSTIPQVPSALSYLPEFREKDALEKRKQKVNFDLRHRARPLTPLEPEQNVWIRTDGRVDPGHVLNPTLLPHDHTRWKHLLVWCDAIKHMSLPDQQR